MSLRKRFFGIFFILLVLFTCLPTPAFASEEASWPEAPAIKAPGAVVMEASTGTLLYEKNSYEAYYPASTTKLMTALLAIEQCPLSDIVTCSYESIHSIDWSSSRIGLDVGEQLNMEEALYAILLASANEVSYAVAEHIGGTMERFVTLMNKRAAELGCVNTHFNNPHGLDDPQHYSCPYDLALITRQAIRYTTFRRISGAYYHEIPATNLNVARPIGNTHSIIRRKISYEGVFAGKTGHTTLAGASLVTCAERNGLTLICVVMNDETSDDSYADSIALLDYAFDNFSLYDLSPSGVNTKNAFPVLFKEEEALVSEVTSPLSISQTTLVLPLGASYRDVTKQFALTQADSLSSGENIIGEVGYYYAGRYVGSAKIIYLSPIDVPSFDEPETEHPDASSVPDDSALPSSTVPPAAEFSDLRPLIIASIVTILVLCIGGYLMFLRNSRRRRKRNYRNSRRGY